MISTIEDSLESGSSNLFVGRAPQLTPKNFIHCIELITLTLLALYLIL